MVFHIRPLDAVVDVDVFRCGEPQLDTYIRRYASQDIRRGLTRVFVATPEQAPQQLAGFFSLSAGSVSVTILPDAMRRKLPSYPVPVALLGRLAVDERFQGQGLGAILLADACLKVAQASTVLAVAGLVVDAKSQVAAAFYKHFGFIALPGDPGRLLLPGKAFPAGN
ncbi:MAG: GNAT family N-acetyltransferase [Thiobacillus sp.]|nr:GNAT family N-acetyltransferase [Thiobacillus sp.]